MPDPISDETLLASRDYVMERLDALCEEMRERRPDLFADLSLAGTIGLMSLCAAYRMGEACADPAITEAARRDRLRRLLTLAQNNYARGYVDRMDQIRKENPDV